MHYKEKNRNKIIMLLFHSTYGLPSWLNRTRVTGQVKVVLETLGGRREVSIWQRHLQRREKVGCLLPFILGQLVPKYNGNDN